MRIALALIVTLLIVTPARAEQIATGDPGQLESFTVPTDEGPAEYLLYTPSTVGDGEAVPLYVMTHGCNTEPIEQARANLHHPVAERERFVVLYTDFPRLTHPGRCWRWTDPASQQRGMGDPEILVSQVRDVMARRAVDPERVYAMGMSSGAMMTSIVGAAYPDLFAAIGLMAGGPYRTYACEAAYAGAHDGSETPLLAQGAFEAMGAHARVVPALVVHGDRDGVIHPACGEQALEQWLRTNNLVLSGGAGQEAPLALDPAATRTVAEPGRHTATVRDYVDAEGCLVAQKWDVHGMDHAWSGGSDDPALRKFTDPAGPNAAELSWAFFERYRRTDTAPPCAEAPPPAACTVTVRIPRAIAHDARVRSGGRRYPVRKRRARVTVRGRARVVVAGRTRSGERVRRARMVRC